MTKAVKVTIIPMIGIGYDSEILDKFDPEDIEFGSIKIQRIQILFIKISIYSKA